MRASDENKSEGTAMNGLRGTLALAIAASLVSLGASNAAPPTRATPADFAAIYANPWNDDLFEAFLLKLPKVRRGAKVRYVWQGDLLVDRETIRRDILAQSSGDAPARSNDELKVMTVNGVPSFWPRNKRSLTFAVDRASFPSPSAYQTATANLEKAAKDWVQACPQCGLQMTHLAQYDAAPDPTKVTFVARYDKDETSFIAAAFFPADPLEDHVLVIAPEYFTTDFDRVGVFRHELGHVLGYRHEHIAGIPGCGVEDNNWKPLTPYDKSSVMHYFCGGAGSMTLALSPTDVAGHRGLYGAQ